jgi:hypothetical protein
LALQAELAIPRNVGFTAPPVEITVQEVKRRQPIMHTRSAGIALGEHKVTQIQRGHIHPDPNSAPHHAVTVDVYILYLRSIQDLKGISVIFPKYKTTHAPRGSTVHFQSPRDTRAG